jgi:hypothetical protein
MIAFHQPLHQKPLRNDGAPWGRRHTEVQHTPLVGQREVNSEGDTSEVLTLRERYIRVKGAKEVLPIVREFKRDPLGKIANSPASITVLIEPHQMLSILEYSLIDLLRICSDAKKMPREALRHSLSL